MLNVRNVQLILSIKLIILDLVLPLPPVDFNCAESRYILETTLEGFVLIDAELINKVIFQAKPTLF